MKSSRQYHTPAMGIHLYRLQLILITSATATHSPSMHLSVILGPTQITHSFTKGRWRNGDCGMSSLG